MPINTDPMPLGEWLKMFGKLVAAQSKPENLTSLAAFAEPLADTFGPDAFCTASAVHCASGCLAFPTYGRLLGLLKEWRAEHGSRLRALPAPVRLALPAPATNPDDELREPATVEHYVARYEAASPSMFRRAGARLLLERLERINPDLLPRFADRLDRVIWPRDPHQAAQQAETSAAPATRRVVSIRPPRAVPLALQLAEAERALARNPRNEAMRATVASFKARMAQGDEGSAA